MDDDQDKQVPGEDRYDEEIPTESDHESTPAWPDPDSA